MAAKSKDDKQLLEGFTEYHIFPKYSRFAASSGGRSYLVWRDQNAISAKLS